MKKVIKYVANKEEWKEAQKKELNKISKKVRIDGFRPGKAPLEMVEKKYGADILIDAANSLIDKEYKRILFEDKILPALQPKIDIVKSTKDEFEVNFTLTLLPTVKLGKYKNLDVKKEDVEVTQEEVNQKINSELNYYAELVIKEDEEVETGDIAVIDFEGFKDGVAFDGGKAQNYSLEIGSGNFIPGFEDGIIGMKKGEEKDLDLEFPEDYGVEDLKGQKVVFKVKVNEIKRRELPELDEEFFKDLGLEDIKTEQDYEKMIKDSILKEKEYKAENNYIDKLLEKGVSNMEFEIDDDLVLLEATQMYKDMINDMGKKGIKEDLYLQYVNSTKEDIINNLKDDALRRIKNSYLIDKIAKEEKIVVSDEEVENRINEIISEHNVTREEILDSVNSEEDIRYDLKFKKVLDIMKGNE